MPILDKVFRFLISLWVVKDAFDDDLYESFGLKPGAIVAVTYGSFIEHPWGTHKLALGTQVVIKKAAELYKRLRSRPPIFWVCCEHVGDPDREDWLKRISLRHWLGLPARQEGNDPIVRAANASDSVGEALAIRDATKKEGIGGLILVVCLPIHSPTIKYIYDNVFGRARVLVKPVGSFWDEVDVGMPVWYYRHIWPFFLLSVIRHLFLRLAGFKLYSRLRKFTLLA